MKKLILISCMALLCSGACWAQNKALTTGEPLHYEAVIKTDSALRKDRLFKIGLEWFSNTYNSGKAVIQTVDENHDYILGRAKMSFSVGGKGLMYPMVVKNVDYMIKLSFKDGRIKYELYGFNDAGVTITDGEPTYKGFGSGTAKKYYTDTKLSIDASSTSISNNLVQTFTQPAIMMAKKNDNW